MDFIFTWILEACDFFHEYIASESNYIMLKKLIEYLEFPGAYELKYAPTSVMNLVLLKGDEDETYSNDELSFLENAINITIVSNLTDNTELYFFEVELNCPDEIRDLVACALIKILNKSFKTKNVFVFKCFKTIAIGSKFVGGTKIFDDFCISKWYSQEDNMEEILELSYEHSNAINMDLTLINFSNEIMRRSHLVPEKNYDNQYFDIDYVQTLIDIQASYGIDLTKEIQKYNDYEDEDTVTNTNKYRQLSDELRFIAPEDLSSYDYLELAQKAEEKANKEVHNIENYSDVLLLDELKNFDEDAFLNAEKMLEYIDDM